MKRILEGLIVAGAFAAAGCQQQASFAGVLALNEPNVTSIAVDDGFVYWTRRDGTVKKVSLDTGAVTTVATGQTGADNLVVDATHVVWSSSGVISALAKDTGAMVSLTSDGDVRRVSTDATHVYWTADTGSVNAAPKLGGAVAALATAQTNPLPITAGAASVFWADAIPAPASTSLMDPSQGGGEIMEATLNGGSSLALLPAQDNPVALLADTGSVYWANLGDSTNGTINIAALDGSNPQVLATGETNLWAITSDAVNVYYSSTDGRLNTVPASGGNPEQIVIGPADRVSIAMDATNIYFANASDDGIFTMLKPQ